MFNTSDSTILYLDQKTASNCHRFLACMECGTPCSACNNHEQNMTLWFAISYIVHIYMYNMHAIVSLHVRCHILPLVAWHVLSQRKEICHPLFGLFMGITKYMYIINIENINFYLLMKGGYISFRWTGTRHNRMEKQEVLVGENPTWMHVHQCTSHRKSTLIYCRNSYVHSIA